MKISPIPVLTDNYVWVIEKDGKALVVDPGQAAPVSAYLQARRLTLTAILLTHHHGDHTAGVPDLLREWPVPVIAGVESKVPWVSQYLTEGETLLLPGFPVLSALSIPGHTLDHMAYRLENALFTGDTVFSAGCGRVFEGTFEMMYASLQKIAALPPTLQVYCGHEYTETNLRFAKTVEPDNGAIDLRLKQVRALRAQGEPSLPSSLQLELAINPFLRCKNLSEFVTLRQLKDAFR